MIVSLLALGLLFAPSTHAFFRLPCSKPVLNARADPIVSYGKSSSHAHTIQGSNAISFSTTFEDLRESNCTTCMVKDDKSIYWIPQLYYEFSNGSFQAVTHGGMIVYYLQRGGNNETIQAFPDGLRMVTGDPYARNDTGTPASQAISWLCLDYSKPYQPQTPGITNTVCPDGLRAQVFFPGCWDGINLDSSDHKSHMAYPDGIDNGVCPSSHPVHLISVFFEAWYSVDPFNKLNDNGRFVLSTGDPTGFSLHGDFYDGWDKSVLQRAVDTCTAQSGVIQDCPVFENEGRFNSDDEMNSCMAPNPIPGEDVGDNHPIPYLPGCIAVTPGPAPATAQDLDPNCLAANGLKTPSSSSILPASSSLASPLSSTTPGSSDNSVPSSSIASPLPSTTPASGDEFVVSSGSPAVPSSSTPASGDGSVPSSSLASPLPSTTPAPGNDAVIPSSSPAMPSSSTPASGDDSVPSSSLSSPLPSTTPAPGDDSVLPSSSPAIPTSSMTDPDDLECDDDDDPSSTLASPLPSTTPAPGNDSVIPSSSPAMPLPSSVSGYGDGSVPSGSLSSQMPPPSSSSTPVPSSVSSPDPMLSSSPALPSPSGDKVDAVNGNGNSSPIPSTQTSDPASTSLPMPSSSSSVPKPSGYGNNNSTNNQQDDSSNNDGGSCTGHPRPSASNKASRAVSRAARRRHFARRGGHGTNLGY